MGPMLSRDELPVEECGKQHRCVVLLISHLVLRGLHVAGAKMLLMQCFQEWRWCVRSGMQCTACRLTALVDAW